MPCCRLRFLRHACFPVHLAPPSPPRQRLTQLRRPALPGIVAPRHDIPGLPNFARVSDGLYRGAQPTADGFRRLREMGVKTVVSLRSVHSDRDLLKGTGMRYVRIRCEAWDPDSDEYAAFLKVALAPENQPVFVHCQQGVDRTGVAVASYRMVVQGWTAEAAIAELDRFGHNKSSPR